MPRIRTIKPSIWHDERFTALSVESRLLFIALLNFSDDMGRGRYVPKELKANAFPSDVEITPLMVEHWLKELEAQGLIEVYQAPDVLRSTPDRPRMLFRVINFLRHQVINHPTHSTLTKSPSERGPDCVCERCEADRRAERKRSPWNLPESSGNAPGALQEQSGSTTRVLQESGSPHVGLSPEVGSRKGIEVGSGIEVGGLGSVSLVSSEKGEGVVGETSAVENVENFDDSNGQNKTNPNPFKIKGKDKVNSTEPSGDRRTRLSEYRELAVIIAEKIDIPNDDNTIAAMISAMWRVSTKTKLTEVAAGNVLMQRAALAKQEERPESWQAWFEQIERSDVR